MRGLVDGLSSPHPLARGLPAIYREEDPFTVRLTQAFDDSLAPIVSTLDNLSAYFDPRYAPEDFLGWLAGWVAIELDETWEVERRRAAVSGAADLLRRRGTAGGLASEIGLATGGQVEIVENGGSGWSLDAGSPMIGSAKPSLLVRLRVTDASTVDRERLERIVDAAKPAHVPHRIEIVAGDPMTPPARRQRKTSAARPEGSDADASSGDEPAPEGDTREDAAD